MPQTPLKKRPPLLNGSSCINIGLIGAGAVGALYASRLHKAGAKIHVVSPRYHNEITAKGIQIDSIWGDTHWQPDTTTSDITRLPNELDYLLICTKVVADDAFYKAVSNTLHRNTTIVLIQNGIDIESRYPKHPLISGLAFVCSSRRSPTHVQHTDYGRLVLGCYPTGTTPALTQLVAMFTKAGVPCVASEDIRTDRYKKLVWNAPFNPLSVIYQRDTKALLDELTSREEIITIMREVQQIAKVDGVTISDTFLDKMIADTQAMVPYKPSMLLDAQANRPIEIEAILGNALRIAKHHNLQTPAMLRIYRALLK